LNLQTKFNNCALFNNKRAVLTDECAHDGYKLSIFLPIKKLHSLYKIIL